MRQFKYFRQIFACLPGLATAVAFLSVPLTARSQDDRLSAKEEERSTPAVDALKDALRGSEELEERRKILRERVNDLKGVRDLRLALLLRDWRDEGERELRDLAASLDRALALGGALEFAPLRPEEAVPLLDRSMHKEVEARLTRIILNGLKSGDPARQIASATILAELGAQTPATRSRRGFASTFDPELAKLLKDKNPEVVESAAWALGRINADPRVAASALRQVIQSGRDSEKQAAAAALVSMIQSVERLAKTMGNLGVKATAGDRLRVAESVLIAASPGLEDSNAAVRRLCVEAIALAGATLEDIIPNLKPASDLTPMDRMFSEEDPIVVAAELSLLADLAEKQARPLAARLKDSDAETRLRAARALKEMASARSWLIRRGTPSPARMKEGKGIAAPASDPEDSLRKGLLAALTALTVSLSDPDVRVRLEAVTVIDLIGPEARPAARDLAKALKDPDLFVRWAAARALGNIDAADGKVAVSNLGRLLFDPDLDPRLAAAATLEHYGKESAAAVPDLTRAIGVGDAEIRVAVIHALEAIGPEAKSAVPALGQALVSDPDDRVRQAAAEALSSFGPLAKTAEPALRRALDDPESTVRKAASSALLNLMKE